MATGDREVTARILIRADGSTQVKREFDESSKAATAAQKKIEDSQKRVSKAVNTASNYILGGAALVVGYSVKSALSTQAAQTKVQNSLKTTNLSVGQQTKMYQQMSKAADYAATHGGGSAPEELAGMAQLTTLTGSATKAMQANTSANKLAVGAQISYTDALSMVSGAEAGRMRGLQKYIGIVTPVKTAEQALANAHGLNILKIDAQAKAMGKAGPAWKTAQLQAAGITKAQQAQAVTADKQATGQKALTMINQKYAGAQETMKQKIQDAKHALEITAASIGKMLLPIVVKLTNALKDAAGWISKHKGLVVTLGSVLVALAGSYKAVKAALAFKKTLQDIGTWFSNSTVGARIFGTTAQTSGDEAAAGADTASMAWRGFMMSTIFGLVIVGITLMITHWKLVKKIAVEVAKAIGSAMTAAWNWIKGAFMTMFNFIKNHWQLILAILMGPIGLAALFIKNHFKDITNAFNDVWKFIQHAAGDILKWLEWPFVTAWNFIKKIPGKIVHLFTGMLKSIPIIGGLFGGGGIVKHMVSGGPVYAQSGYSGPKGTDNVPAWLTVGEGVVNRAGMNRIGGAAGLNAINSGTGTGGMGGLGNITIQPGVTVINLDGRRLAEGMTHYILKRGARGSSSANIGGPQIMGSPA